MVIRADRHRIKRQRVAAQNNGVSRRIFCAQVPLSQCRILAAGHNPVVIRADRQSVGVDLVAEDLAKVIGLGSEDFLKDRRVCEPGNDVGNFAPCLAELRRDAGDKEDLGTG